MNTVLILSIVILLLVVVIGILAFIAAHPVVSDKKLKNKFKWLEDECKGWRVAAEIALNKEKNANKNVTNARNEIKQLRNQVFELRKSLQCSKLLEESACADAKVYKNTLNRFEEEKITIIEKFTGDIESLQSENQKLIEDNVALRNLVKYYSRDLDNKVKKISDEKNGIIAKLMEENNLLKRNSG